MGGDKRRQCPVLRVERHELVLSGRLKFTKWICDCVFEIGSDKISNRILGNL